MVDVASGQDVPRRMLDMLRIFLTSSSAGEHCVLVLESRNGKVSTKYRSVEVESGDPVQTSAPKKKNPARARRSKLRLEKFLQKKASQEQQQAGEQISMKDTDAGDTSNTTNRLICKLGQGVTDPVEAGLDSPIPQLDGGDVVEHLTFAFKSDYGEWDILDTLKDILPKSMTTRLISRVRIRPLEFCADHLCTVVLQSVKSENFEWPTMEPDDAAIIREVERVQK